MSNLIVSLNENVLKVTISTPEIFKSLATQVDGNAVDDSQITDVQAFSGILGKMIEELTAGLKKDKPILNFLVEPQDVTVNFITVNKRDGDTEEKIFEEIRSRLEKTDLDSLYFSYQKIAPFVYQFVGIQKEKMEKYLQVSDSLGLELRSIVPWVLLLPRYIGRNEPCIFVSKKDTDQIIALSELNGIYFCQVYNHDKSPYDLDEMISQLSVYRRVAPITKIYTLAGESFSLDPRYELVPLIPADQVTEELKGYEMHALFNKMSGEDPNILTSQLNILNMLPLPEVQNKPNALVYAGASLAAFLLIGGGLFFFIKSKGNNNQAAANSTDTPVVLSENKESSPSVPQVPALNKQDVTIRVENAAGISGLAAKTQDFLESKGWKVPEVDTADQSDRTSTLIKVKPSKKAYVDLLTADMKGSYEVTAEETLAENMGFDVLILVGSK